MMNRREISSERKERNIPREMNKNCNHSSQQEDEVSDEDVNESGYFEFQNDQERQEILKCILESDKFSSETKKSCAQKLYEVCKKMAFEGNKEWLTPNMSKESWMEKTDQIKRQNKNVINTNENASMKNVKSKMNSTRSTSESESDDSYELGFNNNAGRASASGFKAAFKKLENETIEKLEGLTEMKLQVENALEKLRKQKKMSAKHADRYEDEENLSENSVSPMRKQKLSKKERRSSRRHSSRTGRRGHSRRS